MRLSLRRARVRSGFFSPLSAWGGRWGRNLRAKTIRMDGILTSGLVQSNVSKA